MNDFENIIKRISVTRLEPGDYTGEDGLLYCGKCHTPKQFRMDAPPMEGRLPPHPCRCEQERLDREAAEQEARRHRQAVDDLKRRGFTDPAMREWTFTNDNGKCQQMKHAHFYVDNWPAMRLCKAAFMISTNFNMYCRIISCYFVRILLTLIKADGMLWLKNTYTKGGLTLCMRS